MVFSGPEYIAACFRKIRRSHSPERSDFHASWTSVEPVFIDSAETCFLIVEFTGLIHDVEEFVIYSLLVAA